MGEMGGGVEMPKMPKNDDFGKFFWKTLKPYGEIY